MNTLKIARTLFPNEHPEMQRGAATVADAYLGISAGNVPQAMHEVRKDLALCKGETAQARGSMALCVLANMHAAERPLAARSKPEPTDIVLSRCVVCDGHHDTGGDYCPRCEAASEEDEGLLDALPIEETAIPETADDDPRPKRLDMDLILSIVRCTIRQRAQATWAVSAEEIGDSAMEIERRINEWEGINRKEHQNAADILFLMSGRVAGGPNSRPRGV